MSGRGGIYKGPDGDDLYGDGREVDVLRDDDQCTKCYATMSQRDGDVATELCDHCAHDELARLNSKLDREVLARVIWKAIRDWNDSSGPQKAQDFLADAVLAHLKGQE